MVDYEGRNKTVKASEMAEIDHGQADDGRRSAGHRVQRRTGDHQRDDRPGRGEKNIVGYVLGHKEPPSRPLNRWRRRPDSPISVLKTFIENENIKFQELNLFEVGAIPADMKTIMIAGPQYDFSDREMKLLRDFWNKQGRILLLARSRGQDAEAAAFLNELGVKVNDDRLMALVQTGIEEVALSARCAWRIFSATIRSRNGWPTCARHFLAATMFAYARTRPRRGRNIQLAASGPGGERLLGRNRLQFGRPGETSGRRDKATTATPLTIAVSIEKGGSADERVQMNSSRMVVVSNATFIQDNALTQDQQALDFISGT